VSLTENSAKKYNQYYQPSTGVFVFYMHKKKK